MENRTIKSSEIDLDDDEELEVRGVIELFGFLFCSPGVRLPLSTPSAHGHGDA